MPIYLLSPSTILVVEVIIKLNNMIDKKIESAKEEIYEDRFLLNGEEVVFDNDTKEEMFYKEDIKEAIGLGAKLAINELLNNLWHPASEKPREFAEVLAEAKITESIKTYISFKRNDALFKNWDAYSSGANITRWLYIDDLLPKEGGEQ
ncbi:hypothetical protein DW192_10200 [Segatella copri]|uniref:Uncharacterized protein n=2 Tax=Segatella copri TaxID=165179 RepID=A0A3R6EYK7_9BACT|nr:hypothetical protein DW192_10200 [Segatella copri]